MFEPTLRNQIIGIVLAVVLGTSIGIPIIYTKVKSMNKPVETVLVANAEKSKRKLLEGNQRYMNIQFRENDLSLNRRTDLAQNGQHPIVSILSCSDSRLPPELVFDAGLGEVFTVRNAGNVVDPLAMGSLEYGAEHLKTPLVVVMGHEKCGAVKATVDGGEAPGSIGTIVEKILPSFKKVQADKVKKELIYEKCEDENINRMVAEVKKSPIINELILKGELSVIGAKYKIETGEVVFVKYTTLN